MIPEKERDKIAKVAQKYAKKGKLQEAIAEYQKLLTENSVDLSVRSTLGDLYVRSNQKEKAIEEFQKIASHYQERGLYSQSIAVYKKINKLNPSDIKIGMKLADLYYNQGFLSEAKKEYQRIADNLKENKKVKEAIRLYEKLLKLDERDVQSRLTLAQLYKEEKLFDQAVEEFNKVAEFKMQSNALKEAEEILNLAKNMKKASCLYSGDKKNEQHFDDLFVGHHLAYCERLYLIVNLFYSEKIKCPRYFYFKPKIGECCEQCDGNISNSALDESCPVFIGNKEILIETT